VPLDPEIVSKELVKFGEGLPASLPDYIQCLESQYLQLTINGLDDKAGYDQVHKARMDMRDLRVKIEKKRKELKEDSLSYGRAIDAEAKRINAMIEPIETYLANQEQAIDTEKERIRRAKEEKRQAVLRAQIEAEQVKKLAEENARLEEARKAQEEEQRRLQTERDSFESEKKAAAEALRQKEIQIEAERIAQQRIEELRKAEPVITQTTTFLPEELTPEQQEIMRANVAVSNTIYENHNKKQELIALFFEPYDVNFCDHVEAPFKEKHVLFGHRYIVKDQYIDKDIVEYILDAIFPTEVSDGRE
jgi:chemotaxis protein histidine kinase CheA